MRIAEHREHQYFERTLQHRVYPALRLSEGRLHIVLVGRRLYLPSTLGVSQRGFKTPLSVSSSVEFVVQPVSFDDIRDMVVFSGVAPSGVLSYSAPEEPFSQSYG